jgi:hypothetical protein
MTDAEFTTYSVNRAASDPLIVREVDTAPTLLGEALAKNADNGVRIVQTLPVAVAFNQRREPRMSNVGYSLMAQPGVGEQLCMHDKELAMDETAISTRDISATVTTKWAKGTGGYAGINETENLVLSSDSSNETAASLTSSLVVRRLTPLECERLMGWGENHTLTGVEEDGKVFQLADSHRYRLCGNGVVANVSEWLGRRLVAAYRQANLKDTSTED